MSFFIGHSKSPAVPVASRDTPRRLFPSRPPSSLSCSFLSFIPVQNLIPSSLKGLISPLLLVLFPRHPLKRAKTAPGGRTFERAADTPGIDGTNISAGSVTARVCVSVTSGRRRRRRRRAKRGRRRKMPEVPQRGNVEKREMRAKARRDKLNGVGRREQGTRGR